MASNSVDIFIDADDRPDIRLHPDPSRFDVLKVGMFANIFFMTPSWEQYDHLVDLFTTLRDAQPSPELDIEEIMARR